MLKLKEKDKEILKEIKRVILDVTKEMNIEIDKIILFGSRARGDYREDSDWDILIITKDDLKLNKKLKLIRKIKLILSKKISTDIIIMNKKNYYTHIDDIGHLVGIIQDEKVII